MDWGQPCSSVHGILQQEHWSGLPFLPPGDLPDPGIEPASPALQVDFFVVVVFLTTETPGKPLRNLG